MPVVEKMLNEGFAFEAIKDFDEEDGDNLPEKFFSWFSCSGFRGKSSSFIEAVWMAVSDWVLSRETQKSGST